MKIVTTSPGLPYWIFNLLGLTQQLQAHILSPFRHDAYITLCDSPNHNQQRNYNDGLLSDTIYPQKEDKRRYASWVVTHWNMSKKLLDHLDGKNRDTIEEPGERATNDFCIQTSVPDPRKTKFSITVHDRTLKKENRELKTKDMYVCRPICFAFSPWVYLLK